jgi:hypothetical protein
MYYHRSQGNRSYPPPLVIIVVPVLVSLDGPSSFDSFGVNISTGAIAGAAQALELTLGCSRVVSKPMNGTGVHGVMIGQNNRLPRSFMNEYVVIHQPYVGVTWLPHSGLRSFLAATLPQAPQDSLDPSSGRSPLVILVSADLRVSLFLT